MDETTKEILLNAKKGLTSCMIKLNSQLTQEMDVEGISLTSRVIQGIVVAWDRIQRMEKGKSAVYETQSAEAAAKNIAELFNKFISETHLSAKNE